MIRKRSSHGKNAPSVQRGGSDVSDRRPLQSVPLAPPDYVISPKVLLESYVEKEVIFMGSVGQVPANLDVSRRAEVLMWVDRGHASGFLSSTGEEVIISMCAQNVKLCRHQHPEEVLLRIPVSEIGSVLYVRDDGRHLVLLLHAGMDTQSADPSACYLSVLVCENRMSAEEICALVRQCFHLVYTEATMQFFDRQLSEVSTGLDLLSLADAASVSDPSPSSPPELPNPGRYNRAESCYSGRSDSEVSSNAADLLQDYMQTLRHILAPNEVRQFASLIRSWQQGAPFPTFCRRLLQLFTPERIHLLAALRPFVPQGDQAFLDDFVQQHSQGTPPRAIWDSVRSVRSVGRAGEPSQRDVPQDFDRRLAAVTRELSSLESIVTPDRPLQHPHL